MMEEEEKGDKGRGKRALGGRGGAREGRCE